MVAVVTPLHVAAERRGATEFDCAHGAMLRGANGGAVQLTVSIAVATEDLRDFWVAARHRLGVQAGAGTGLPAVRAAVCRTSSGLAVAHTLVVARRRYLAVVLRLR